MPSPSAVSPLRSLVLYCPLLSKGNDDRETDNILYFYPEETDMNRQLKHVGFCIATNIVGMRFGATQAETFIQTGTKLISVLKCPNELYLAVEVEKGMADASLLSILLRKGFDLFMLKHGAAAVDLLTSPGVSETTETSQCIHGALATFFQSYARFMERFFGMPNHIYGRVAPHRRRCLGSVSDTPHTHMGNMLVISLMLGGSACPVAEVPDALSFLCYRSVVGRLSQTPANAYQNVGEAGLQEASRGRAPCATQTSNGSQLWWTGVQFAVLMNDGLEMVTSTLPSHILSLLTLDLFMDGVGARRFSCYIPSAGGEERMAFVTVCCSSSVVMLFLSEEKKDDEMLQTVAQHIVEDVTHLLVARKCNAEETGATDLVALGYSSLSNVRLQSPPRPLPRSLVWVSWCGGKVRATSPLNLPRALLVLLARWMGRAHLTLSHSHQLERLWMPHKEMWLCVTQSYNHTVGFVCRTSVDWRTCFAAASDLLVDSHT